MLTALVKLILIGALRAFILGVLTASANPNPSANPVASPEPAAIPGPFRLLGKLFGKKRFFGKKRRRPRFPLSLRPNRTPIIFRVPHRPRYHGHRYGNPYDFDDYDGGFSQQIVIIAK